MNEGAAAPNDKHFQWPEMPFLVWHRIACIGEPGTWHRVATSVPVFGRYTLTRGGVKEARRVYSLNKWLAWPRNLSYDWRRNTRGNFIIDYVYDIEFQEPLVSVLIFYSRSRRYGVGWKWMWRINYNQLSSAKPHWVHGCYASVEECAEMVGAFFPNNPALFHKPPKHQIL